MSNLRRAWVVGASVVILAVGFAAAASPRRTQDLAATRDARHAAGSSRPAGETPAVAPVAETPRPVPAPPPPRVHRAPPPPASSGVTAVVEDPPTMWEDTLFPALPASSRAGRSTAPCFDQLQGIGGVSPCPEVTQRGLK
ncbi:MAG TPA: hypothetical protein VF765_36845 [Polyangiaceae bacterium]